MRHLGLRDCRKSHRNCQTAPDYEMQHGNAAHLLLLLLLLLLLRRRRLRRLLLWFGLSSSLRRTDVFPVCADNYVEFNNFTLKSIPGPARPPAKAVRE